MTYAELLGSARYVVDAKGEKTDVMVPLPIWNTIMGAWERLMDAFDTQEDPSKAGIELDSIVNVHPYK